MNTETIILTRLNNGDTLKFDYDTPIAQVYTGVKTGLVGSSIQANSQDDNEYPLAAKRRTHIFDT